jgi:hypothetical protein
LPPVPLRMWPTSMPKPKPGPMGQRLAGHGQRVSS